MEKEKIDRLINSTLNTHEVRLAISTLVNAENPTICIDKLKQKFITYQNNIKSKIEEKILSEINEVSPESILNIIRDLLQKKANLIREKKKEIDNQIVKVESVNRTNDEGELIAEEEVDKADDNQPITFELLKRTVDFINQLKPYEQVLFVYKNKIGKKCFQNIFKLNVFIDAILQPSCDSLLETYEFHQHYNFLLTRYKVENYLPKEVTKQDDYINKLNYYNEKIRPMTEEICKQLQEVLYPDLKKFFDYISTSFESEQLEQSTSFFKNILQPCCSTKNFNEFFEFQLSRKFRPEYTTSCKKTIEFLKTKLENSSTTTVPSSNDFEKSICEAVVKMDTNTPEIIFMHNRLNRLFEAYIATPTSKKSSSKKPSQTNH